VIIHDKGGIKIVGSYCEEQTRSRCGGKIKHQKGQVVAKLRIWVFSLSMKVWEDITLPILGRSGLLKSARPMICPPMNCME